METRDEKILVAPSILSADFGNIGVEVERLEENGADVIHCDVMDGHFVPNITFGAKFIKDLRKHTSLPLDVHLMISHPEQYAMRFVEAGADYITFHIETECDKTLLLKEIKASGVKCGLAISPDTEVKDIEKYIDMCDIVLLMSVYPGFGGQKFIEKSHERLKELKTLISRRGKNILLEVDGGVTCGNVAAIKRSGANVIVAGNTVFSSNDMAKTIDILRMS